MYVPKQVYFEPGALEYPLGKKLLATFTEMKLPIRYTPSHNRVPIDRNSSPQKAYMEAKNTLVVGVRRTTKFQTCRPSAHYQLPLATSCPGFCEYCYLATTLGKRPYVRVYVNLEEILGWAYDHMKERSPQETIFEGAATSDPIPVERYTGSLARTVKFFGQQQLGRFRFVTKFDEVESLIPIRHNGRTEIRFSLNAASIINNYEHGTVSLARRLSAARLVGEAGYPIGFLVAPIMVFDGWREEYRKMFQEIQHNAGGLQKISFEFVTYRFTARAKSQIQTIFPHTKLDMDESTRRFKFGQFGYGKYLYPPETMMELKEFFQEQAHKVSPHASVLYTV